uniref:GH16 domain-containing protein n=1 Tax=Acrobeloides nanus TaxID=290746 RepID=A0A914DY21_9BILA
MDLNGVVGKASDCCQLCQNKRGCRAYTWDNTNGGTCWLKNDTQPLFNKPGSVTGILRPDANNTYSLNMSYAAPNFFENFLFIDAELTNMSFFVNETPAWDLGIIGYKNGKVYMSVDNKSVIPEKQHPPGRHTLRIQSTYRYNSGLFILSLDHMPTGRGTWPAFWTYGLYWPQNGEIDILEGIYALDANQIHIHTRDSCLQYRNTSSYMTGEWGVVGDRQIFDCYEHSNTNTWGLPTAYYVIGPNCSPDHFNNHTLVFDTALCGAWTDNYLPGGEAACEDLVRNHPEEYDDAYWMINYLKVFCKPGEPCGFYDPIPCCYNNSCC